MELGSLLRGWRFALLLALLALLASPAAALADCGGPGFVRHAEDAQGVTFVGVFEGTRKEPDTTGSRLDSYYHWRVARTYAGPMLSRQFAFDGTNCNSTRFRSGVRYLVSYNPTWGNISTWNTLAYVLSGNGRARLVGFDIPASQYPAEFDVGTLARALAVLTAELPPTDQAATRQREGSAPWVLAMVFGSVLVIVGRRRSCWLVGRQRAVRSP
jgi:hypothetical protein